MRKEACFLSLFIVLVSLGGCRGDSQSAGTTIPSESREPDFTLVGTIVFQSNVDGDNDIYLLTAQGTTRLTDNTWDDRFPVWSPDGGRIAYYANPDGNQDIFLMDADGSHITAVTGNAYDETEPAWFPDGKSLAYTKETKRLLRDRSELFRIDLETGRSQRLIPRFNRIHGIPHVSPTQPLILFTAKRTIGWDAAVYNWETRSFRFLEGKGKSCRGRFSKDGTRIAYVSSQEDGKGDIWVMKADGTEKRRLTARDDTYDYFPSWSPDGRHIVFCSSRQHDHEGDWQLWVVEVETGQSFFLYDSPGNDVFPDWR